MRNARLENRVKLKGELLKKGCSDHAIDLACEPELRRTVLACLPGNYARRVHFVDESESKRVGVSLFDFVPPTKPEKSDSVSNEIFHLRDFSSLLGDWIVEPKYDGLRAQVHKHGEQVKIFDPQGDAVESKFPCLVKAVEKMAHQSFILDGEIVKYRGKSRLAYQEMISFIRQEDRTTGDSSFRYKFFDVLYLNGADLTPEPLEKRKKILMEDFQYGDFVHPVKFERVTSDSLASKIKELSSAEGAMIRKSDSTYFDCSAWFEWKKERELEALVTKVIKNKGGSYNYVCVVGSRSNPILIGTTYSTNLEAKVGDIIRVQVDHLAENQAGYSWYAPRVKDIRQDRKEPDPIPVLKRMMGKEKQDHTSGSAGAEGEKRFVLQVRQTGERVRHNLRFSRNKNVVGLTLFKLDLDELDRGKKFVCEWNNYHDPKWLDFSSDLPPGDESKKVNSGKDPSADAKMVDWGDYEIVRKEPHVTSFRINGNILSGIYVARKVTLNRKQRWLFWKKKETMDQN